MIETDRQRYHLESLASRFSSDLEGLVRSGEPDGKGQVYLLKGKGPPNSEPLCPSCQEAFTRWRGPHPSVHTYTTPDRPITPDRPESVNDKTGAVSVLAPSEDESRPVAARRLYRVADVHAGGPRGLESVPGVEVWQPGLCASCENEQIVRWFDAYWPAPVKPTTANARAQVPGAAADPFEF